MHEDSTEGEEMKRQERMKVIKDVTKQIRSKGRMEAESRWWVTELVVADCEKAWHHPGCEDTKQKWSESLKEIEKKDEKGKWRKCST